MDAFTTSYIETALWSTTDNANASGGSPLDDNYGVDDIAGPTLARMIEDCAAFQEANVKHIGDRDEQAGYDFWLTREGHGAGFWDGDWDEPGATVLTDAAHAYGSFDLYVGDDGKVYGA
jgi:hypothetical protein